MAQNCRTAFDDVINKEILNDYNKLSSTKKNAYKILGEIDNETQALGNLPSNSFDNLRSIAATNEAVKSATDSIKTATTITECVDTLDGDCLGGAIGGINGLIKDTTGFVSDALDTVKDALDLPTELLNLTSLLSQLRKSFGDGGIDRLLSNIFSKLGCIGNKNSQLLDIENDINTIISDFGLNADGSYDENTFNGIIENKLNSVTNIPENYKSSVIANTKKINTMTKDVQESAVSNLKAVKANAKQAASSKVKPTFI